MKWAFFGTDEFATRALEELANKYRLKPDLLVATPGNCPTKHWAERNKTSCIQPDKLKPETDKLTSCQLFVVASYGKILPAELLALPHYGTLNIHPSLLPKYRGPSPIQSALLAGETETGVSLMLVDAEMDHGPIIATTNYNLATNKKYPEVRDDLAVLGAQLLADTLPGWLAGEITPTPQDHAQATYTKKIKTEDGLIKLTDDPDLNWRKFRALSPEPGVHFFTENNKRVKITIARFVDNKFAIDYVTPEGKREMDWASFLRGYVV